MYQVNIIIDRLIVQECSDGMFCCNESLVNIDDEVCNRSSRISTRTKTETVFRKDMETFLFVN